VARLRRRGQTKECATTYDRRSGASGSAQGPQRGVLEPRCAPKCRIVSR
jgi:hypothetical protein